MSISFAIDDAYLPATLNCQPMTDEEFIEFCQEHPDLNFETTAEGELIVMAPTQFLTGVRNSRICHRLVEWAERDHHGIAVDSSTGFVLPNGARRSPDASWILHNRIRDIVPGKDGFLHLCPDFVIELKSSSDRLGKLKAKMREYMANGAHLGWLINPDNRSVIIYRPDVEPELRKGIDSITGEGAIATFTLDLKSIWNPLE
jgi:Uma2 family endonuclease